MGRIAQEKVTVERMIAIYCRGREGHAELCADCRALLAYALRRLDGCRYGEGKPACKRCPVHCYALRQRDRIREVMRYAGPRMLWHHPLAALSHLLCRRSAPGRPPKSDERPPHSHALREVEFENPDYLLSGTPRQREAYDTLARHYIMSKLSAYTPVLAGTIPINVDVADSDLDVICSFGSAEEFGADVERLFGTMPGFDIRKTGEGDRQAVVASFRADDFEVEVFGQAIPVRQQNAYRHMVAEHRVLMREGEDFRRKVVALKRQGLKTEPAFASLLGLEGDPYEAMLDLYDGERDGDVPA